MAAGPWLALHRNWAKQVPWARISSCRRSLSLSSSLLAYWSLGSTGLALLADRSGVRRPAFAVFRAVPVAYVLLFAFFVSSHGKAHYLTPIYPVLLAIGAISVENWMANGYARGAAVVAVAASGAVIAPLAIPMMSEEAFIRYSTALRNDAIGDCDGTPEAIKSAAGFCRHAWLAGNGGEDCQGLLVTVSAGAAQGRIRWRQLRRSRRHRHLRFKAGPAAGHQRSQQLLDVGAARSRRKCGDRDRWHARKAPGAVRFGRVRRLDREPLCHAL